MGCMKFDGFVPFEPTMHPFVQRPASIFLRALGVGVPALSLTMLGCLVDESTGHAPPVTSGNDTHANDQQSMRVDTTKKTQGKLVIVLGGIGGGPGPGGIYGYAISKGFHGFLVATQSAVSSAPAIYKDAIKTDPMDPEAN